MDLKFKRQYKSIKALNDISLPKLTILCGLNGSGKTHILEAISNKAIFNFDSPSQVILMEVKDFIPLEFSTTTSMEVVNEREEVARNIWSIVSEFQASLTSKLEFIPSCFLNKGIHSLSGLKETDLEGTVDDPGTVYSQFEQQLSRTAEKIRHKYNQLHDRYRITGNYLQEKFGNKIALLSNDIIIENIPEDYRERSLFGNILASDFHRYHSKWLQHGFEQFSTLKIGEMSTITRTEIDDPKPWEEMNHILMKFDLHFRIQPPVLSQMLPPNPTIVNSIGDRVDLGNLSSGEKTLLTLAFGVYNLKSAKDNVTKPAYILLDELDAFLHPSMIRQLLHTLQSISSEWDISVVMTTHSPTTVALSPEGSLFVVERDTDGQVSIEHRSKDKALSVLLRSVPCLSFDYENHKQVFVESKNDKYIYEAIKDTLDDQLDKEIAIHFVSSGTNELGSCEQVKRIVGEFRQGGCKSVFGIIDWDKTNQPNDQILILGAPSRYAIENYVFDPIAIAAYLANNKLVNASLIGLDESELNRPLNLWTLDVWQKASSFVVEKVLGASSSALKACEYPIGCINIRVDYIELHPHDAGGLFEKLKAAYAPLSRFRKDHELAREIVNVIYLRHCELISSDFLCLLRKLERS